MVSDVKLQLFRQIDSLPEIDLLKVQEWLNEYLTRRKANENHKRTQTFEDRLKELEELAAKYLTEKPDFESYMKAFEESTQDRPLPFRED